MIDRVQKRGRWLLVLLAVAVLVTLLTTPARADDDDDEYIPGEILVKLVQSSDLAALANEYSLDPTPLDQFGTRAIYRLRILDDLSPEEKSDQLGGDARVLYAEPNFVAETPESRQRSGWAVGGGSSTFTDQWAPRKIKLAKAHLFTKGKGIVVAVLDTGVDLTHPKLVKKLVPGYDFVDMDNDPSEVGTVGQDLAYGHGTHVAGLIRLVAPKAKIMPLRVLDPNGKGNVWVLAEAFAFALDPDGNSNTDDGADVINLSLSTMAETELLTDALRQFDCDDDDDDDDDREDRTADGNRATQDCPTNVTRDVVIVAAAGNSASSTEEYPAAEEIEGLIAVAASTQSDTLAPFSNFGSWVAIAAPGMDINSTVPGGYGTWSGTSMAAPMVAGAAALVRARHPNMDAATVVQRISNTAKPINADVGKRLRVNKAVR